jgi:hypothetical protein
MAYTNEESWNQPSSLEYLHNLISAKRGLGKNLGESIDEVVKRQHFCKEQNHKTTSHHSSKNVTIVSLKKSSTKTKHTRIACLFSFKHMHNPKNLK